MLRHTLKVLRWNPSHKVLHKRVDLQEVYHPCHTQQYKDPVGMDHLVGK